MTVAKVLPLKAAIFNTVASASGLTVFNHAPTDPPEEFIRIDGFSLVDDSTKNGERGRHSFLVHHFLRPGLSETHRGTARGTEKLAAIHAALMASTPVGGNLDHEEAGEGTDIDGATAHVWSRYSVIL